MVFFRSPPLHTACTGNAVPIPFLTNTFISSYVTLSNLPKNYLVFSTAIMTPHSVPQETVKELESTNTLLRETEHMLSCSKTVLQKAAAERDEQRHLVEKHVETELKLAQQAKKLLSVR